MGHYSVAQRAYKNDAGDYYLHENGLRGDLMRVLGILNQGESTINLARTTIREPEGTTNLPHMRVTHAVLGETYLPEAINYFRNRKGVGSFPFDKVPTADVWGTHSSKEGVNMRWIVELLEAVGRSTGATGPRQLFQLQFAGQNGDKEIDLNDPLTKTNLNTVSSQSLNLNASIRGGNALVGGVASTTVFHHTYLIKGIDLLPTGSDVQAELNDWEELNESKIVYAGSVSAGSQQLLTVGDVVRNNGATYYEFVPEQTIYSWQTPTVERVPVTNVAAYVGRSDTIPTTVHEALASIGSVTGRYVLLVPPSDFPYEESGVVTTTYSGLPIPDSEAQQLWTYQGLWSVDLTLPSSAIPASSWLFWTEPVIPVGWPDDEYTTP